MIQIRTYILLAHEHHHQMHTYPHCTWPPPGPDAYLAALDDVISEGLAAGKLVAYGEFGLDYDRLQFCDRDTQLLYFARQFNLASKHRLPLFMHMRAACADFVRVLGEQACMTDGTIRGGVVHSFTGSWSEAEQILLNSRLAIGVNGCSLKTEENLEVVR